jgi:Sulfatase
MATPTLQPTIGEELVPTDTQKKNPRQALPFALIKTCTLSGVAGFLLLSLLEQLDLNWRLNSLFSAASERIVLLAYSSVNVLVGAIVGFLAGLLVVSFFTISAVVEKAERRLKFSRWGSALLAILFTAGITATVLNQFSRPNSFVIGSIRELEKLGLLRDRLLNHERLASYLMLMGIVTVCALIATIVKASDGMNRYLKMVWIAALTAAILLGYYVDSRVEVQLYEFSLHRSLYLAGSLLAMALAGTLLGSTTPISRWWARPGTYLGRGASGAMMLVLIASLVFTWFHFGKDQNLKTQLFFRSTQLKQNILLAWWVLDRDRDGYSALLDGGDSDETNKGINPGVSELLGDGIDNNGMGGDLTQQDVDDWRNQHHPAGSAAPSESRRFNIVYIFVDTVRADHLGAYGYHRKTTPNLDRLAEQSVVFENGFSPAARTAEAIPRFMQSSYWDARIQSWPEVLAHNDYKVMLFPGRRSWERYATMMHVVRGGQGKPLEENIDFIIDTLGKTGPDRPFCAYVYIPDPHLPYLHHPDFDFGYGIADLYDGELAYTDHQIGRLLDWLDKSGRFQDTMIVVMSDHGESLGERDVYRHATQLYSEQTHVPMIIYTPGIAPRRIPEYVSTIDLGSTILSANGIARPDTYLGVNLVRLMQGEALRLPPVFAEVTKEEISKFVSLEQQVHPETKKYMAITQDGFKIIFNRDVFTFELYDLKNDPGEQHNLYSVMPEKAAKMTKIVFQYVDIVTASRPPDADEGRYSKATGADGDKVED